MPSFSIGQLDVAINKHYVPKIKDNFLMNRPLLKKLYENKETFEGGQDIRVPVRFDEGSNGGAWSGGVGSLQANFVENVTHAIFPICHYYGAMMIPQTYLWLNRGKAKLTSILENQSESMVNNLHKTLGLDIHGAGGLNSAGHRKIDGIQAAATASGTDPSYASFGGISRSGASGMWSSPTGNAFWGATVFAANANTTVTSWKGSEVIDNLTTISIAKLQQMYGFGCREDVEPEMIFCRQNLFNAIANLMSTYRRYGNADDTGKMGFKKGLEFNGAQIISDDSANSGEICMVNFKDLKLYVHDIADFFMTDARKPVNQETMIKYMFSMLSLTSDRPNTLVRVTGFTG